MLVVQAGADSPGFRCSTIYLIPPDRPSEHVVPRQMLNSRSGPGTCSLVGQETLAGDGEQAPEASARVHGGSGAVQKKRTRCSESQPTLARSGIIRSLAVPLTGASSAASLVNEISNPTRPPLGVLPRLPQVISRLRGPRPGTAAGPGPRPVALRLWCFNGRQRQVRCWFTQAATTGRVGLWSALFADRCPSARLNQVNHICSRPPPQS
jgi:hypothetical protein